LQECRSLRAVLWKLARFSLIRAPKPRLASLEPEITKQFVNPEFTSATLNEAARG
jgi:hypothetical protein